MSLRLFRIRRFSIRVLALVLSLLFATLATTYLLVSRFNESNARDHAAGNLDLAAHVFEEATRQRIEYLAGSASVMSNDDLIKQILLKQSDPNPNTVADALESYTQWVGAPVIALFDKKGNLIANSQRDMANENVGPFAYLIREATRDDKEQGSGFSYLKGQLHVLVVVPLYAPYPNIAAWFGLAFPIDEKFAQKIKATSRVEVTFVSIEEPEKPRVLATTLPPASAAIVARAATDHVEIHGGADMIDLPDDRYVTLFKIQEMLAEESIRVVLQRGLSPELASARELESYLLLISLAALAVATLLGFWIARGVSQPVLALAEHTRHIAAGDYERRIDLRRADELGQLAGAFNTMSAGLSERDRIRDLLDKNVSPEVAAQLLRDGATLGGEEREVTILFADLRGFTTLSEKFAPRDLVTLLNRYLDRMSDAIESQGGVIDKFIGDGIMALFGAPVAQSDAADRALTAARAMERALAELNVEFAAEGRPPLGIGIGVNTARVIAGNIGSHRRLNYSVVGDGVNVAARLESLTRAAEYRTNIITSFATRMALRDPKSFSLRPLGSVQVKGRNEPVEIFAVD